MGVWYATREDVKAALDSKETARNNTQIDRGIEAASRGIEDFLHRPTIAPTLATRYKDWPSEQFGRAWRVWLDQDEVITLSQVVSGGTVISASDYFLEPVNEGPPFNRIEINLAGQGSFRASGTWQHSLAMTGLWGYWDVANPAGQLAAAVTDTVGTAATVSDSSAVGVGSVLKVDSERFLVTEKTMVTTSQTLQTPLTALSSNDQVAVTDGTQYHVGEVILLDTERMRVVDLAANNLTVKRAWDGTTLAQHNGSTIYAPRLLTVARGALGTAAATHSNSAPATTWQVPGPIRTLCIAEVLNTFEQESSAYARVVGGGDSQRAASGAGIADERALVFRSHGRKARSRVV